MFEHITLQSTMEKLRALLPASINTMEGSWYDTELRAAALMHVEGVRAMEAMLPIAFPDETAGLYIDQRAKDYGITRQAGTRATVDVVLRCIGSDGVTIPSGTVLCTATGLGYTTDMDVVVTNGTATVTASALNIGCAYNQPAEAVVRLRNPIGANVVSIASGAAAGGTDAESDAALYARLKARLGQAATGENVHSYHQWAMSVTGVRAAKVVPRWQGRGTVQVLVFGEGGDPGTPDLLDAVAHKIEQERPIGSDVTVSAPAQVPIRIHATVQLPTTLSSETVQTRLTAALKEYLQKLIDSDYSEITGDPELAMASYPVVYTVIASELLAAGALDYTDLTVSGGTSNIIIPYNQIPQLTEVTILAAD